MTSVADGRERKMRILYRFMLMVSDDLELCSTAEFGAKTRNNVELSCFLILARNFLISSRKMTYVGLDTVCL